MLAYVSTAWWSLIGKMDFARMFFRQLHFVLTCYYSIIVFDDMSTLLLLLTVYILGDVSSRKSLLLVTDALPGSLSCLPQSAIACIQSHVTRLAFVPCDLSPTHVLVDFPCYRFLPE